jgi:CubicO group peptidase (beta-lactamase class C family)
MFTSREQALDSLPKLPLPFAPGERWAYNQTNYLLLQEIIARTSGMPYVRFVQSEIFDPLGMRATVFDGRAVVANHATHYGADSTGRLLRRINDATTIPFLYSAGGVNTSASDLLAFAEALRTHRILSERSVEQMWTPVALNDGTSKITVAPNFSIEYGYGFLLDSRAGHRSAGHSGGGTAAFRVFPDDRVSVVVLHNGQGPDPDALLMGVASRWIPALH